ncbi:MAG TPA: lipid-A-disaccharide synthase [Phycisphaerae bacterium]|nr:lipid-A-disaccharide synthase [Phycisphaerae bacterium]
MANLDGSDEPTVLISACEASADTYGAELIQAMARRAPKVRFAGLAGPMMREAGCEPIADLAGRSAMLLGAVANVGVAVRVLWRLDRLLAAGRFAAAVLIDSPTLNLPLARRCRRRGVPVMYYVAPQTWAWGQFRVGKIRRRVDRLACILPFEPAYFAGHGIEATYVGHPLFDQLASQTVDDQQVAGLRGSGQPVVALLPGSRRHIVGEVLPGQLDAARIVARRFPSARFLISVASKAAGEVIEPALAASGLAATLCYDHRAEMIRAADLALVASGTATLEVAYRGTPMIVMYNASRWGYQLIGRWLIHTRHLALINVLAGREVVPEFMPYYRSAEPIGQAAVEMLLHPDRLRRMRDELRQVIAPLASPGASEGAAEILLDMLPR